MATSEKLPFLLLNGTALCHLLRDAVYLKEIHLKKIIQAIDKPLQYEDLYC